MRTSFKYQVERNDLDQVVSRFAYITITPSKKETTEEAINHAYDILAYFNQELPHLKPSVEMFENDYATVEFGDIQTDDKQDIQDTYKEFTKGARVEATAETTTAITETADTASIDFGSCDSFDLTGEEADSWNKVIDKQSEELGSTNGSFSFRLNGVTRYYHTIEELRKEVKRFESIGIQIDPHSIKCNKWRSNK